MKYLSVPALAGIPMKISLVTAIVAVSVTASTSYAGVVYLEDFDSAISTVDLISDTSSPIGTGGTVSNSLNYGDFGNSKAVRDVEWVRDAVDNNVDLVVTTSRATVWHLIDSSSFLTGDYTFSFDYVSESLSGTPALGYSVFAGNGFTFGGNDASDGWGQVRISNELTTLNTFTNASVTAFVGGDGSPVVVSALVGQTITSSEFALSADEVGSAGDFILVGFAVGGNSGGSITLDNLTLALVPEPSSAALIGLGGVSLILRRRK